MPCGTRRSFRFQPWTAPRIKLASSQSEMPRKTNPVSDQITLLKTAFGRG